jgi:hypothetical protein
MKTYCCNSKESLRIDKNVVCLNINCNNYLGKTRLHRDFNSWKKPVAISLFAFHLLFSIDDFSMDTKANSVLDLTINKNHLAPLTVENLKKELHKQEIICSNEVLAQMKLESAYFNSSLLHKTNNLMGMRFPFSRPTAACGIYIPSTNKIIYGNKVTLKKFAKQSNYAVYSSWQDAVADYKLWQESNFKVKDRYLDYLGKVYAEDQLYVDKIRTMAEGK